jgi:Zn-dependent oligopeptidase
LDYAEFVTFIENAQNAQKRKELIDKSSRRGGKKNVKILEKLVSLRKENAKLLGYTNHVEFKTIERMAKNSKNVQEFLLGLLSRTSRLCKEELRNLKNYKREKLSNPHAELTYYDIAYLRKQQKKEQFGVDEELLRQFFPQAKVVKEMFALFEKIFEIKIEEAPDFPVWHDEVRLYKISDRDGVCGYFFFDLYPRKNKYAHAAGVMHIAFSRSHSSVTIEHFLPPVEVLLANFARPNKKGDALMSHGEIVALFHEFGHILHNLLNKTVIGSQAGTLVARDFVETPSQMFENWAWNENVLKKLSSHYLTRESLTKKQCQKIIESDRYGRGYFYTKQLTLALFDYDINAKKIYNFVDHYHKLVKRYLSISMPKQYLFVPGFMHIYRGYDSGYYVYMWSLVYAQDMFERFKKEGVMNKKVGKDFRTWILEPGSSEDEMKLVKGFLGRKPNNKAFLREMGV